VRDVQIAKNQDQLPALSQLAHAASSTISAGAARRVPLCSERASVRGV